MRTFVCVRPTDSGNLVTIAVRSPDPDGKAFLAQTISEVDWLPLFIHSFICHIFHQITHILLHILRQKVPHILIKLPL